MPTDYSCDIVSKLNRTDVENALELARQEIQNRFDFKDRNPIIEQREKCIYLQASGRMQLQSMLNVVEGKLIRGNVSLKFLEYGKEENTATGASKLELVFKEGIGAEESERLAEIIRRHKLNVKIQIQKEQLKITSPDKDELQRVIQLATENEALTSFQFVNFR